MSKAIKPGTAERKKKMKQIAEIENAKKIGNLHALQTLNISGTFYWAYDKTQKRENKNLDFHDVIWDNEINDVFENLQRFGIKTFTISNNGSGMLETLAAFQERGCKIAGMVKVNGCNIYGTDEIEIRDAIKLQMPR